MSSILFLLDIELSLSDSSEPQSLVRSSSTRSSDKSQRCHSKNCNRQGREGVKVRFASSETKISRQRTVFLLSFVGYVNRLIFFLSHSIDSLELPEVAARKVRPSKQELDESAVRVRPSCSKPSEVLEPELLVVVIVVSFQAEMLKQCDEGANFGEKYRFRRFDRKKCRGDKLTPLLIRTNTVRASYPISRESFVSVTA